MCKLIKSLLLSWLFGLLYYSSMFGCCSLLNDDLRNAAFADPDFSHSFVLRSNNVSDSFREILTGRNQMPFHVSVHAKVLSGVNAGFFFEAVGAVQVSAEPENHPFGGLVFAYDRRRVRIWAPSLFEETGSNGQIIVVGKDWGGQSYSQTCEKALVVVHIWYTGPSPTFQANTIVNTADPEHVFVKINHNLEQIPERVMVRVTPYSTSDSTPNHGFWFNGITASQNSKKEGYGGVIFAYDTKSILLWAPSSNTKSTGCIFVGNKWGRGQYAENTQKCMVHIFAWVLKFPVPSFKTEWYAMISQGQNPYETFLEVNHNLNKLPLLVVVQGQIGTNGLIFEGTGTVMSSENNTGGYGGILFAYDKNYVRVWLPKRYKEDTRGYGILVKEGWGDGHMLQAVHKVSIRVILYSSICDQKMHMKADDGDCKAMPYNSFQWVIGPWSKCSSICDKGVNHREILGCSVSTRETVLECDFARDMCGWHSLPIKSWSRVKNTIVNASDNFGWNLPKDFFYIFALSLHSEFPVKFLSPKFSPRRFCTLSFAYKMFGIPRANLSILVLEDDDIAKHTEWTMRDNQGGDFWRRGFLKLSKYPRLTGVIFQFILADKSTSDHHISGGNVSIDDIQLVCEKRGRITTDAKVCVQRKIPSAGCLHPANLPNVKGPAYGTVTAMSKQVYVVASGRNGDLIGSYDFQIHHAGEYALWLVAYGRSPSENGVKFKIDNHDDVHWHTIFIDMGRPMWQQFVHETFALRAGVHTVHFTQMEKNFRFSHVSLLPKELHTWVPLGIQNRFIPDSFLSAFPPFGLPDPKFARLNGYDAWCSSDHNAGYVRLEITLPQLALVSRIAVQGGDRIMRKTSRYWVSYFYMKVSVDGEHSSWYRASLRRKGFHANSDSSGIVEHELPFAVLAKKIMIFPYKWANWICMRTELYGIYMTDSMCAAADGETETTRECRGDRNCSLNADCKPLTNDSIIKTALQDGLSMREVCHCHDGYHGDSCQHVGCQPNPCHHKGKCVMTVSNFTCKCKTGYHGRLCQWPCPVGKYGKNCTQACQCSRHGSCNIVTGHCACEPGYYGLRCERRCPRGYFGVDCREKCQCVNNADCDNVNGTCYCSTGWTGEFCDQPCENGTWGLHCEMVCHCSENALSCDPLTGECVCQPGAMGKTCDKKCPFGTYGLDCSGVCQCSVHGVCNVADGSCTCLSPGFTGVLCDQHCSNGFYGLQCKERCHCASNAECDFVSGMCMCGNGFYGSNCSRPCQPGRWGAGCRHVCGCKNNATCDSITGDCECKSGWHGPFCDSKCQNGYWGSSCNLTCDCRGRGFCDSRNGQCLCDRGWTGPNCTNRCQHNTHGRNCQQKCSCLNGAQCDPFNGTCTCSPGWYGRTCAQACPSGYFGKGCNKKCECANGASCDPVHGTCSCTAGWRGRNCSHTCSSGLFGTECAHSCRCGHHVDVSCNHVTGECFCAAGYTGPRCSRSCDPGRYGLRCLKTCECQNDGECRPNDGRCICLAGFIGDKCEHKCPPMTFGVNCTDTCGMCAQSQSSSCDHVTGKCICLPGYYGYHCENECPEGKYGQDCALDCECANEASCHHVNGTCGCTEGFIGSKCEKPCPQGKFGANCLGVCLCENGASCDKVNGKCQCLSGFTGSRCMDKCPDRSWGIECQNKCSCEWNQTRKCRGDNGQCLCHDGYRGATCQQFCEDGTYGEDCKHPCPVCSRHVIGTCYKIDGRCPCSPGYRGHLCESDCMLKNYGKNCGKRCDCDVDHVCHHVTGACYLTRVGRFQIVIKENFTNFDEMVRRKQLKLNVAVLIAKYNNMYEELRHLLRRRIPVTSILGNISIVSTQITETIQPATRHDFVARILDLKSGLTSDGSEEVVAINMVMFDGEILLNGSIVKDVISCLDEEVVSNILGCTYYSGVLYSEKAVPGSVYSPLVIGASAGSLGLVVLMITLWLCRKRRRRLKKIKSEKKRQNEAEMEIELRTRGIRHNGYRLAFDNPYYDVLAAMALEEDVEEDYINPLCDLDSLMSHQGSDESVSSVNDCSIDRGESLQSISYC